MAGKGTIVILFQLIITSCFADPAHIKLSPVPQDSYTLYHAWELHAWSIWHGRQNRSVNYEITHCMHGCRSNPYRVSIYKTRCVAVTNNLFISYHKERDLYNY